MIPFFKERESSLRGRSFLWEHHHLFPRIWDRKREVHIDAIHPQGRQRKTLFLKKKGNLSCGSSCIVCVCVCRLTRVISSYVNGSVEKPKNDSQEMEGSHAAETKKTGPVCSSPSLGNMMTKSTTTWVRSHECYASPSSRFDINSTNGP